MHIKLLASSLICIHSPRLWQNEREFKRFCEELGMV